ncbi:MAG: cysteine desulfurase family protein [Bryobacteraceae bacterium]
MPHARIYLDYNASTPLDPDVAAAVRNALAGPYGNPSSGHWAGAPAREMTQRARAQVAGLLDCDPGEIVFTSGGSEANNHALKGVFFGCGKPAPHFITSQVEHPAVLNPLRFLERLGARVTYLPVDGTGMVDPDDVRRAIRPQTVLVSVMHANNETGAIEPVAAIGRLARERGVLFHTDAAQSVGKIPVNVRELHADLLSVAGHKLYAPKGVGALYVREGVKLEPLVHGAGHEAGRRAGTESVLLDIALGQACETAEGWVGMPGVRELRDHFHRLLVERFGVVLNGHPEERLPNTLNVSFPGRTGAEILARAPEIAASTGSACHAGAVELSPVLKAMGVPRETGMGAIRFSLGRGTTREEIEQAVALLAG